MLLKHSILPCLAIVMGVVLSMAIAPAYAAEVDVTPANFAAVHGTDEDSDSPFDIRDNWYQFDFEEDSTITFGDGEYVLNGHLNIPVNGTTLKAAEGATPILIANYSDAPKIITYGNTKPLHDITIDGLTFRSDFGSKGNEGMITFTRPGGISNLTITNNVFENSNLIPIRVGSSAYSPDKWSNIIISNNVFQDISHKVGIYLLDAKDSVISGNTFSNVAAGVNLDHPKNVHIYDNHMLDVNRGVSVGLSYESGTKIYDNTIIHGNYHPQLDNPYPSTSGELWAEGLPTFTQTIGIAVFGASGVEVYDNLIDGFDTGFFIYHEPSYGVPETKRSIYNSTDRPSAVVSNNTFSNNKNSTIYNAVPDYKLPVILNTFLDKDPAKDDVVHGDVGTLISYDSMGRIVAVDENSNAVTSEQSCAVSIDKHTLSFTNAVYGVNSSSAPVTVTNTGTGNATVAITTQWITGQDTLGEKILEVVNQTNYFPVDGSTPLAIESGAEEELKFRLNLTDEKGVTADFAQRINYMVTCG